jgi:hypothetical protein
VSHKNASYVDEIVGTLIRFKPEVWQEQADAKRADRKIWEWGMGSGEWGKISYPYSLFPTPYSLLPTPYSPFFCPPPENFP